MNIDSNFDRIKDEVFDSIILEEDLEQENEAINIGAYEDSLGE